jgi:hypothetical protein
VAVEAALDAVAVVAVAAVAVASSLVALAAALGAVADLGYKEHRKAVLEELKYRRAASACWPSSLCFPHPGLSNIEIFCESL